jgi:hypothetical protein
MDVFSFKLLHQEHQRILAQSKKEGVTLRLLGALAFELRCQEFADLRLAMGRTLSDLDYLGLTTQWDKVVKLITSLGYSFDERRAMLHGHERLIFFHPDGLRVDVFFDRLDMCHTIDLRQRLAVHDQTIPLADLLLEKLQIVQITEKDIIDIIILFLAHPVEQNESGINAEYIAWRMAWDWGFYHTSLTNLQLVRDQQLPRFDLLSESQRTLVRARIEEMLQAIERVPKTVKWKLRSKVGTSVKWYKDVGDLVR